MESRLELPVRVAFPNTLCGATSTLRFCLKNSGSGSRYGIFAADDPRLGDIAALAASLTAPDAPLSVGPFAISSSRFALQSGEELEIAISFAPLEPTTVEQPIRIVLDSQQVCGDATLPCDAHLAQVYDHVLVGRGDVARVELLPSKSADAAGVVFAPLNPGTVSLRPLVVRNGSTVDLPFRVHMLDQARRHGTK